MIKIRAVCLLAETALLTIRLSKNCPIHGKRALDFSTSLRDALLSLIEKKSRLVKKIKKFQKKHENTQFKNKK